MNLELRYFCFTLYYKNILIVLDCSFINLHFIDNADNQ